MTKLLADLTRAAIGMVVTQTCKRCGKRSRNLYWDGLEHAYFCRCCIH